MESKISMESREDSTKIERMSRGGWFERGEMFQLNQVSLAGTIPDFWLSLPEWSLCPSRAEPLE